MRYRFLVSAFVFVTTTAAAQIHPNGRFSFQDRGGLAITTGGSGSLTIGSSRVQTDAGAARPSALAILSFKPNDVLVNEIAIAAAPPLQNGRVFINVNGPLNTALAVANPGGQAATVSFVLNDSNGTNLHGGSFVVPAGGQLARFATEPPFNADSSFTGTLTFTASLPVAAAALRSFINERHEFLMTSLPVIDLSASAMAGSPAAIPHFASGGGWTTEVTLVNPADEATTGTAQFWDSGGAIVEAHPFALMPRGVQQIQLANVTAGTQIGSIRIAPDSGRRTPAGFALFFYKPGSVRVTEIAVPTAPRGYAFRLFMETDRNFGIESGIAIANPSTSVVTANLELTDANGVSIAATSVNLAPSGQTANLLSNIPGLGGLPGSIQGVIRISANVPVSAVGIRKHVNERGEFLFTSYPAQSEGSGPDVVIPHFADGGGYSTEMVLFSTTPGPASSGSLQFLAPSGGSVSPNLFDVSTAKHPAVQLIYPNVVFPGTAMWLTLTGSDFVPGRTRISLSGHGISTSSLNLTSGTSATATFVTDPGAALGDRTVTVTSAGGVSDPITLSVVNVQTAATPGSAAIGQTNIALTVVAYFESIHRYWLGGIQGVQFYANGVNDLGIMLTNVQIQGNTINASMSIGINAMPGLHTIALITPSGNIPSIGTFMVSSAE